MPFEFVKTEIPDVILIAPKVFEDDRGWFMETFQKSAFDKEEIWDEFKQDNHSKSTKGVLRGLHYQVPPYEQAKIVRCVKGEIYDVAVDLRPTLPTCGKYVKVLLSEENKKMLYIPKGFAHGFVVLSEEAEICYKASREYKAEADAGVMWNDPDINIDWEIDFKPIISKKDQQHPSFKNRRMK